MSSGSVVVEPYRVNAESGIRLFVVIIDSDGIVRAEGALPNGLSTAGGEKNQSHFRICQAGSKSRMRGQRSARFSTGKTFFRHNLEILGQPEALAMSMATIAVGRAIKPGQSNLSLAVDRFSQTMRMAAWRRVHSSWADIVIGLCRTPDLPPDRIPSCRSYGGAAI